MKSLFEMLKERGFVSRCTDDELPSKLNREKLTVYAGFDPTASSLHLGNLVPIMVLAHMQRAGHRVIAVVGGATGSIGDPSGKSAERVLLSRETVAANGVCIATQLGRFLETSGANPAIIVDNQSWFEGLSWLTVLRDVGKHFSLSAMLARDSVKNRLDSESGISFTEFAYQVMQGFDFLHLFDAFGCTLQLGGSDQWGNIVAGIDLVRKVRRASVAGLTLPLVTTAAGEKFGKSAGNAIWLDAQRTPPWQLFQYLVRQDDGDVGMLLRLFTFLPEDEIASLEQSATADAAARRAQRKLAFEVVALVHGQAVAQEMVRAAAVMFGGELKGISEGTLEAVLSGVPSTELTEFQLNEGIMLSELLRRTGLAQSLTRAREFIRGGGAYINNVRVESDLRVGREHLASTRHIVLRRGKRDYHVLRIAENED